MSSSSELQAAGSCCPWAAASVPTLLLGRAAEQHMARAAAGSHGLVEGPLHICMHLKFLKIYETCI